ncbi:hypothetical protein [Effusibacillus lacus]|uniref:Uncharacterized protein n=1 Tax=Effusibacillus lacus TaxID=1348429 RepID=A0A292YR25_9BACL|nr:hypothetical protein [Effusibacillus lacus]TCS76132.1 hypothetical protein EDD64_104104 [Effusibacillus lacus]GAX91361.1 hypothetical protein EFBL_3030 [Effusibacillus lacus]
MTFLTMFALGFIPVFLLFALFQKSLPPLQNPSAKRIGKGPFEYAVIVKNQPMKIVVANSLEEALSQFEGVELENVFIRVGGNWLKERNAS